MANLRKRTPEKDARLIGWLRRGDTFGDAVRKAGYRARTVYEWRNEDPEYDAELRAAAEAGEEFLLGKLVERGFFGFDKPVYQGGKMVGAVREYDTTAAIFSLKARNPKRFNDKLQVEHGGQGGGPLQIVQKVYHVDGDMGAGPSRTGTQVIEGQAVEVEPAALPSPQPEDRPAPGPKTITIKRKEF